VVKLQSGPRLYGIARIAIDVCTIHHSPYLRVENQVFAIQSVCPKCSGHGLAHRVLIKDSQRTVTYECANCGHRWDITESVPKLEHITRQSGMSSAAMNPPGLRSKRK
jgi:hypothetical protein